LKWWCKGIKLYFKSNKNILIFNKIIRKLSRRVNLFGVYFC